MQNSVIFDPRAAATPTQAQAASQRAERLRRIGSKARQDSPIILRRRLVDTPIVEDHSEAPIENKQATQDELFAIWVARQREKHAEELRQFEARALARPAPPCPPIEMIQKVVAHHCGLPWTIMFTAARTAQVVRARQMAMYFAKTVSVKSLPEIGRRFGGRDHTTVLHAVRKMEGLIERDPMFAAEMRQVKSLIEARRT